MATAKQIAARKLFAERARAGAFKRKAKRSVKNPRGRIDSRAFFNKVAAIEERDIIRRYGGSTYRLAQYARGWILSADGVAFGGPYATFEKGMDALNAVAPESKRRNPEIHVDINSHNTGGRNVRAKNPLAWNDLQNAVAVKDAIAQQLAPHVPFVNVQVSTLGGQHRASVMITVSFDPRSTWVNGILENSRYAKLHLGNDGTLEKISGYQTGKLRKSKVKSVSDAVAKILSMRPGGASIAPNPRARRVRLLRSNPRKLHIAVMVRASAAQSWRRVAHFFNRKDAFEYARAWNRAYPSNFVKVEKV